MIDLVGHQFGLLIVIAFAEKRGTQGQPHWRCSCDCGGTSIVAGNNLKSGATTSCGCVGRAKREAANLKHGAGRRAAKTPEYIVWKAMHQRCENPRSRDYPNYGGRGIAVCARWNDFAAFIADMGPRPAGLTIDRINNDGNYEPTNCRWTTRAQQNANKRPRHPELETREGEQPTESA